MLKKEIVERIESQSRFIKNPIITESTTFYELTTIKGTFCGYPHADTKDEYPFFGVLLQDKDTLLIEEFHELLQAVVVYETYYFVTLWEKPEACSRSMIIYKLENETLVEIFSSTRALEKEWKERMRI